MNIAPRKRLAALAVSLSLFSGFSDAAVTFQFNYIDQPGQGFNAPGLLGQQRQNALELAGSILGSTALGAYNTTIVMDALGTAQPLAAAGGFTPVDAMGNPVDSFAGGGFGRGEVVRNKILSATDLNGAAPDGDVNWDFNETPWELDINASATGPEYDFYSTVYHELVHALGWSHGIIDLGDQDGGFGTSGNDIYGNGNGTPGEWNQFDQFISDSAGTTIIDPATFQNRNVATWNTLQEGGPSPGPGGLFFNGANAVAANGGAPVGLFTPNPIQRGSSITHLDDDNPALVDLMMLQATNAGPSARILSAIELGVLMDLGYGSIAQLVNPIQTLSALDDVDVDGDWLTDMLFQGSGGDVALLQLRGTVTFDATTDATTLVANSAGYNVVGIGDIVGLATTNQPDGLTDVLFQGPGGDVIAVELKDAQLGGNAFDPNGAITTLVPDSMGYNVVAIGDIVGLGSANRPDGFTDILFQGPGGDVVAVELKGGKTVSPGNVTTLVSNSGGYNVIGIGDVLGLATTNQRDGFADILFTGPGGDVVAVELKGANTIDSNNVRELLPSGTGYEVVGLGDVLGLATTNVPDGLTDILLQGPGGDVLAAELKGSGAINAGNVTTLVADRMGYNVVGVGDVLGTKAIGATNVRDGLKDILFQGPGGDIVILEPKGASTVTADKVNQLLPAGTGYMPLLVD